MKKQPRACRKQDQIVRPLKSRLRKDLNKKLVARTGSTWADGALAAANLAGEMYNSTSAHPYDLTDCILAKMNLLARRVRKNPYKPNIKNHGRDSAQGGQNE